MGFKTPISELLSLSVAERILLVEDLWDSIANCPEAVELTDFQRQELDRRMDEYRRDPSTGSPWDIVKSRITSRA